MILQDRSKKKFNKFELMILQELDHEVKQQKAKESPLAAIICFTVLARQTQVANQLWSKTDAQLLVSGRNYVDKITLASGTFASPVNPTLAQCTDALDEFEQAIIDADGAGLTETATKNVKREAVMNILTRLALYVEGVANDPANATTGPVVIIDLAGMRPKPFTGRGGQQWAVYRGPVNGSLKLTAGSIRRGAHEWAWTTTPSDDNSWTEWNPDKPTRANTVITGLTRGAMVYCRHRTLTAGGVSDWEGHDPVIVP